MTRQRTFKRLVRTRMAKTGESYTAARAALRERLAVLRSQLEQESAGTQT